MAACLFLLTGSNYPFGAEIAICDLERKMSWDVQGRPTKTYAYPKWAKEDIEALAKAFAAEFGTKFERRKPSPDERIILIKFPKPRPMDVGQVFIEYPNGERKETGWNSMSRDAKWVYSFAPVSVKDAAGPYRIGIANDRWKTTGTRWFPSNRTRGEKFTAHPSKLPNPGWGGRKPDPDVRAVTVDLSTTPQRLAWRVVAYDLSGNEMEASGSWKQEGKPPQIFFRPINKRDPISRVDLQRRPIKWVTFAKLPLSGPTEK